MINKKTRLFSFCLLFLVLTSGLLAINTADTAMLTRPAIGKNQIAFVYAGNLWVADLNGKNPRQLTVEAEVVGLPVFSPDGKWLAFSAQRNGNVDVYLIPAEGGQSRRLTWHPGADLVQDFTPDGQSIFYTSPSKASNRGASNLFVMPVNGGFSQEIPIPYVYRAKVSPDGRYLAYNHFQMLSGNGKTTVAAVILSSPFMTGKQAQ